MTIAEIIAQVDSLKPNEYKDEQKIEWLDEADKRIITEIISGHELSEEEQARFELFSGYTATTPMTTELLVPAHYASVYRWWLEAQIDLANMEIGKYNNSMLLYAKAYQDFAAYWLRTHRPVRRVTHWKL